MLLERIVYSCLCILLTMYIGKKFFETKGGFYIILLGFQVISVLVQVLSVFKGVYPNYAIQVFIVLFAIITPAIIFISDYLKVDINEFFEIKIGDILYKKGKYNRAIEIYQKTARNN